MSPDLVNGCFELIGAMIMWQNVVAIRRDKMVRGLDWRTLIFTSAWGLWNLFFYPSLDQWASFAGGVAMTAVNCTWLFYVIKYKDK